MHFRKFISLWALLALMLGQIALAQHSASHIDHGISFELTSSGNDEHHHHQEDSKKHQCPECVLTKSFQTAFYNISTALSFAINIEILTPAQQDLLISINHYKAQNPRAPPVTLI